jgi:phospholipid/cholesterol/gamma-HCH transport system permease protein
LPQQLQATAEQLRIFERVAAVGHVPRRVRAPLSPLSWVMQIGRILLTFVDHARSFVLMMGQLLLDFLHLLRHPKDWPRLEISANLYKSGVSAMPVTAIVGFLIGVVMSYLSSLQLKQFGGDVFIVNILGMSIIRELGPVLVAVLVAGRSGSAMTAQLGVMRVTEEIDALATMGVSQSLRLIFPKVLALAIALPLLTLWISGVALLGGMIAAEVQLDISFGYFFENLPKVVPIANLWIGLTKGFVFGIAVALVACHFGLRIKPNTESLSVNTTASVVSSITLVILIDAIVAIITRDIGLF